MSTALAIPEPQALASWGDRKLDNAIGRGHAAAGAHMRNYEEAATLTGVLLRERKRRLRHGEWLPWLEEHFDGNERTAQRYLGLADEWLANTTSVSDLESRVIRPMETPEIGPVTAETVAKLEASPWASGEVIELARDIAEDPPEVLEAELVDDRPDLRHELIDWFAKGRVVLRALQDADELQPIDRELRGDVDLMVLVAGRVKEVLFR